MNSIAKRATNIAFTFVMICLGNAAFAAPILFNKTNFHAYDEYHFDVSFEDLTIEYADDGSSVTIWEDPVTYIVEVFNDPSLGNSNVIIPGINTTLSFDYEFNLGPNNVDDLWVNLYDTYDYSILDGFYIADVITEPLDGSHVGDFTNGTVSFNLSNYIGTIPGLSFQLVSNDDYLDSTVTISDLRLETVNPIPEPSTLTLFLLGGLLFPFMGRRFKRSRSAGLRSQGPQ